MKRFKVLILVFLFLLTSCKEKEVREITKKDFIMHDYDFSNLSGDEILHYEDDKYISLAGIDISEHNKEIDFAKVKNAGIEFVYIRAAFRGSTEGVLYKDYYFDDYYKGAKENDLIIGFYLYSQAINEDEAREEANYILDLIKDKEYDLPICYDLEDAGDWTRVHNLTVEQRTNNVLAFVDEIKKNGQEAIIYMNLNWAFNYFDMTKLIDYDIWFAQYNSVPMLPYKYSIWQYSETGTVDGINGDVDLDIMFSKKDVQP